jgi:hypothetical protein
MEVTFIFRTFKQGEFDSLYKSFLYDNNINSTGIVVQYDRDGDMTTASIRKSICDQLTESQIAELRAVK